MELISADEGKYANNEIKIGGVPEHFNAPVLKTIAENYFNPGEVSWRSYPSGTGAMMDAIDVEELDVGNIIY